MAPISQKQLLVNEYGRTKNSIEQNINYVAVVLGSEASSNAELIAKRLEYIEALQEYLINLKTFYKDESKKEAYETSKAAKNKLAIEVLVSQKQTQRSQSQTGNSPRRGFPPKRSESAPVAVAQEPTSPKPLTQQEKTAFQIRLANIKKTQQRLTQTAEDREFEREFQETQGLVEQGLVVSRQAQEALEASQEEQRSAKAQVAATNAQAQDLGARLAQPNLFGGPTAKELEEQASKVFGNNTFTKPLSRTSSLASVASVDSQNEEAGERQDQSQVEAEQQSLAREKATLADAFKTLQKFGFTGNYSSNQNPEEEFFSLQVKVGSETQYLSLYSNGEINKAKSPPTDKLKKAFASKVLELVKLCQETSELFSKFPTKSEFQQSPLAIHQVALTFQLEGSETEYRLCNGYFLNPIGDKVKDPDKVKQLIAVAQVQLQAQAQAQAQASEQAQAQAREREAAARAAQQANTLVASAMTQGVAQAAEARKRERQEAEQAAIKEASQTLPQPPSRPVPQAPAGQSALIQALQGATPQTAQPLTRSDSLVSISSTQNVSTTAAVTLSSDKMLQVQQEGVNKFVVLEMNERKDQVKIIFNDTNLEFRLLRQDGAEVESGQQLQAYEAKFKVGTDDAQKAANLARMKEAHANVALLLLSTDQEVGAAESTTDARTVVGAAVGESATENPLQARNIKAAEIAVLRQMDLSSNPQLQILVTKESQTAAVKLQAGFRGVVARKKAQELRTEREAAAAEAQKAAENPLPSFAFPTPPTESPALEKSKQIAAAYKAKHQTINYDKVVTARTTGTNGTNGTFVLIPTSAGQFLEEIQPTTATATATQNVSKNRYSNIIPYDHNLVSLEDGSYINASFVTGHKGGSYIMTQGPKVDTRADMLRMALQQNARSLVTVANEIEGTKKFSVYLPQVGAKSEFGEEGRKVKITNLNQFSVGNDGVVLSATPTTPYLQVSLIKIECDGKVHILPHFHLKNWPDHGTLTPEQINAFVNIAKQIEDELSASTGPSVVHCSAGVGRSGSWIATMEGIESKEPITNDQLLLYRTQRNLFIQTEDQLVMVQDAIVQGKAQAVDLKQKITEMKDLMTQRTEAVSSQVDSSANVVAGFATAVNTNVAEGDENSGSRMRRSDSITSIASGAVPVLDGANTRGAATNPGQDQDQDPNQNQNQNQNPAGEGRRGLFGRVGGLFAAVGAAIGGRRKPKEEVDSRKEVLPAPTTTTNPETASLDGSGLGSPAGSRRASDATSLDVQASPSASRRASVFGSDATSRDFVPTTDPTPVIDQEEQKQILAELYKQFIGFGINKHLQTKAILFPDLSKKDSSKASYFLELIDDGNVILKEITESSSLLLNDKEEIANLIAQLQELAKNFEELRKIFSEMQEVGLEKSEPFFLITVNEKQYQLYETGKVFKERFQILEINEIQQVLEAARVAIEAKTKEKASLGFVPTALSTAMHGTTTRGAAALTTVVPEPDAANLGGSFAGAPAGSPDGSDAASLDVQALDSGIAIVITSATGRKAGEKLDINPNSAGFMQAFAGLSGKLWDRTLTTSDASGNQTEEGIVDAIAPKTRNQQAIIDTPDKLALLGFDENPQKNWYANIGGFDFGRDEQPIIFPGGNNLFMANFRGCHFKNVDFSQIDAATFKTMNFYNCTFISDNIKLPEGIAQFFVQVDKEKNLGIATGAETLRPINNNATKAVTAATANTLKGAGVKSSLERLNPNRQIQQQFPSADVQEATAQKVSQNTTEVQV